MGRRVFTKFSLTMPSLAAKKASTCLMKCCSPGLRLSQSPRSLDKSTSSAVQNEATMRGEKRRVVSKYIHNARLLTAKVKHLAPRILTHSLLVELPNVGVLDGEHDEAARVFLKERLVLFQLPNPPHFLLLLLAHVHL